MSDEEVTCRSWSVRDYDLGATLESGQAFGWDRDGDGWVGVVGGRWVRVGRGEFEVSRCEIEGKGRVQVEVVEDGGEIWEQVERYFALEEDLGAILATFPDDPPLKEAVSACRGLRLLRQEPWECLAGFICSSTKQIVQIRQIIRLLRERHGQPVRVPGGRPAAYAFPEAVRIARLTESDLRDCKLGFRAPYLLAAAKEVASGALDLDGLGRLPLLEARARLMALRGVGRKVADCVLLFGFGFPGAFPVDVWVRAALRRMYFPRARRLTARRLEAFSETHFGPFGGYAQQYLFHYVRTRLGRAWAAGRG